jgi:hypothetical protein
MYYTAIADGIMKRETKISDDPRIRKLANKQPNIFARIFETFYTSPAGKNTKNVYIYAVSDGREQEEHFGQRFIDGT